MSDKQKYNKERRLRLQSSFLLCKDYKKDNFAVFTYEFELSRF